MANSLLADIESNHTTAAAVCDELNASLGAVFMLRKSVADNEGWKRNEQPLTWFQMDAYLVAQSDIRFLDIHAEFRGGVWVLVRHGEIIADAIMTGPDWAFPAF